MILGMESIAQARNAARVHVGVTFEPFERVNKRYAVAVQPQDAPDPWTKESRFIGGRGRPVVPAQRATALTWDPLPWQYWEMDQFRGTHYKVYFDATAHGVPAVRGPSWGLRANIPDPAPLTHGDLVGEYGGADYEGDYFPGGF